MTPRSFHVLVPAGVELAITAAFVEPIDHLSLQLQAADSAGGGLHMLLDMRPNAPLFTTCRQLYQTWAHWEPQGDVMRALLHHGDDRRSELLDDARAKALSFGAALRVLEFKYHHGVRRWLGAATLPLEQQLREDQIFFDMRECDLCEFLGRPFRQAVNVVDDLRQPTMRSLRTELRHNLKATNMELEGDLAVLKSALSRGKDVASAEMLCYLPHLHKVLGQHVGAGRTDPTTPDTRNAMLNAGVPLLQHAGSRWRRPDRETSGKRARRETSLSEVEGSHHLGNEAVVDGIDVLWDPGDAELPVRHFAGRCLG